MQVLMHLAVRGPAAGDEGGGEPDDARDARGGGEGEEGFAVGYECGQAGWGDEVEGLVGWGGAGEGGGPAGGVGVVEGQGWVGEVRGRVGVAVGGGGFARAQEVGEGRGGGVEVCGGGEGGFGRAGEEQRGHGGGEGRWMGWWVNGYRWVSFVVRWVLRQCYTCVEAREMLLVVGEARPLI